MTVRRLDTTLAYAMGVGFCVGAEWGGPDAERSRERDEPMWRARRLLLYRAIATLDALLGLAGFILAYTVLPSVRRLVEPDQALAFEPFREYAWLLILLIPGWPLGLALQGLQGPLRERPPLHILAGVLKTGLMLTGLLALTLYGLRTPYSRMLIFSSMALTTTIILAEKFGLRYLLGVLHRRGYNRRDVVVIGSKARAQEVLTKIQCAEGLSLHVLGCLETDVTRVGASVLGVPVVGGVEDYRGHIYDSNADEVLIAMPLDQITNVREILDFCEQIGVTVRIVPDYQLRRYRPGGSLATVSFEEFYGIPMFTLATTPTRVWQLTFKRFLDVAIAGVGLVTLAPVLLLVGAVVKLTSRGPVFYRWQVSGLNGKAFTGYKFRTMVADADTGKQELLRYNEMDGPVFKMTRDPRVTPVGRILRKYSVDELPQLWSVLKGDMSLVGPRPAFPTEVARYQYWQRRKLSVRPGLTCLWQVNGRNAIADFGEWIRMDLKYIDTWSLGLDLKILLKTVPTVLRGTGK